MANFVIQEDDTERMIRKFKKKTKELKIIKIVKDRMFYEKPSEKRRKEKMKSRIRHLKRQKLLEGIYVKKNIV